MTRGGSALAVSGLEKSFGATHALQGVSFAVRGGTVHGLLGENGSGKSTLVKILSGYHVPDAGALQIWGSRVMLPIRAGGYHEIGIGFVHQSLGLADSLSVTENLRVSTLARARKFGIRWGRERALAKDVLSRHGLEIDPAEPVAGLTRSEKTMLAIVRALDELESREASMHPGVLVLDEPTGAFTIPEKDWLYSEMRAFVGRGGAVMFISHDIEEVLEITDDITVLRDGAVAATVATSAVTGTQLAELIVGRSVSRAHSKETLPVTPGEGEESAPALAASVRNLNSDLLISVDFNVAEGEVLGVTGLAGSGYEDLLPILFGAGTARSGTLHLDGRDLSLPSLDPRTAVARGIALVPADRERSGCVLELSISDNVTLCALQRYRRPLGLNRRKMRTAGQDAIRRYGIRASGASVPVHTLSGGNQQKVLLAKWLGLGPELLLLDEPTVGLDVGARLDIFELIREFARSGAAIVCASSDWEQLASICDRVLIFASGRIAGSVASEEISESAIGHECYRASTHSLVGS